MEGTSEASRIGKPSANAVSWPGANSALTLRVMPLPSGPERVAMLPMYLTSLQLELLRGVGVAVGGSARSAVMGRGLPWPAGHARVRAPSSHMQHAAIACTGFATGAAIGPHMLWFERSGAEHS